MKIALVRRMFSLRKGGAERQCVNLARQLMAHGHEVAVLGERIDPELESEVRFFKIQVNQTTSWTKNLSFARNVATCLQDNPVDISYGLSRTPAVDIYRLTERLHMHWMTIRYPGHIARNLERLNPRHRAILRLDESIFRSPNVRRLVAQAQLDKGLLKRYYDVPDDKIEVIHNGVDTTAFEPGSVEDASNIRNEMGIPDGSPMLLFASTMDFEGKGLRWIMRAMKEMQNQDAHLIVLGEGPLRKFMAIAKSLGLSDRIKFPGARTDIQQFYRAADLFIMPTSYEPFPNVNLEAMACGTPVITTSTAGGADDIDENETGYLIPDMEAYEEMGRCMDHHLSLDPLQRENMARLSRAKAEAFSVETNAKRVIELFEQVLREKNRG